MVEIREFNLNEESLNKLEVFSDWPMVYILSKDKNAYVGESYRISRRMKEHLSSKDKLYLKDGLMIYDDMANKPSTLYIEGKLIEYLSAEENINILNGNDGERSHNFYQKELYEARINYIWDKLLEKKFVKKDLREIENTDLFKYSPYKKLTDEQYDIAELISYPILSYFLDKNKNINDKTFLINGEAGTGKSILGIYLLKYLQDKLNENNSKSINIGYVVPMSSFR